MFDEIGRILTRRFLNNPILIIGTGRSGTSILLQALGQHSEILSVGRESPFIPYVGALLHPFEFRQNRDYHIKSLATSQDYYYEQFRKLCFECAFGEHYGLKRIVSEPGVFFYKLRRTHFWCAKTYPNQIEAAGLTRLFLSVKFLYIHRNGCDVVSSRMKFRGMSLMNFEEQCRIWADSAEKYLYLFDNEHAIRVRQEDVVAAPDETFRSVLSFVGVPYEEGPTRFSQTTLIHSLNQRTKTNLDVSKALADRPKSYAAWSDEQKRIFVNICSDSMQKLGYDIPF
jgi:hypothetical protein